ncbi:MAG TPA: bacteriohemerythrin [Pseudomonas sp.]|nr:bacteriohemerythrin [Pseudomonas sp.]
MTFMPWTSELEVGITQIDEQHRWLVDKTNQLYDRLASAEPDTAEIAEVLDGLMDYTVNHFIVEEEIFQRLGYPQTEEHKAQHDRFTAQIMDLLQRHDSGERSGSETLELLADWLTHHILKVDKAYVAFFRDHGVR